MRRTFWLVSFIIVGAGTCLADGAEGSFVYDDILRSYVIYVPNSGSAPYPLVLGLHGTGASGGQFLLTASLIRKANSEGFMVVCPDALQFENYTYFNIGAEFEELTGHTDDIGFISALLDTVITNYPIDLTRIYAMGFSNGSAMAYRVAA